MSLPVIVLKNQFGEESINNVLPGGTTAIGIEPMAAGTLLANLTGSTALPTAATKLAVANALPAKTGVTAISAEALATAITIALSTSDTYSDAAVNAAVNGALVTVVADVNAAIAQINAILAALKVVS